MLRALPVRESEVRDKGEDMGAANMERRRAWVPWDRQSGQGAGRFISGITLPTPASPSQARQP